VQIFNNASTLGLISLKYWTKLQILVFIAIHHVHGFLLFLSFSPSVFSRVREAHRQVQVEDHAESSDPPLRYCTTLK